MAEYIPGGLLELYSPFVSDLIRIFLTDHLKYKHFDVRISLYLWYDNANNGIVRITVLQYIFVK